MDEMRISQIQKRTNIYQTYITTTIMKKVISILLLLLICYPVYSQDSKIQTDSQAEQKSDEIKIYFDHNSYAIDLDLQQNRESLSHFSDLVEELNRDTLSFITKVEVNSYASPEGGRTYNKKLSQRRSSAIFEYLTNTIAVPDSLIDSSCSGTDWDGLRELVEGDDMQYKDEVLYILNNVPEETWRRVNPTDKWLSLVDSRNKHLMDLRYGDPYRYMFANIYPQLRNGSVVTIYFKREALPVLESKAEVEVVEPVVEPIVEPAPASVAKESSEPTIKPLLAIKSNLLYDVVSALNVELEVPIGQRWSIAGEWNFPWWTSCGRAKNNWQKDSNRNSFQMLQGNIEGKYWFGDRSDRPVLTGWFAGLSGGLGKYDLERKVDGYQGELYVVGLSGGYAHTINKKGNLRMEYALGLGYMQTDYDKYKEHEGIDGQWHTLRQEVGKQHWLGPTKAKVSLVWMLNRIANKEK